MNRDMKRRDQMIGDENFTDLDYLGGIRRFENLTVQKLEELYQEGFVDWDEAQNNSPTIGDFHDFLCDWSEVTAHGYVVSNEREDYRLSIEGLEFKGPVSMPLMLEFVKLCRYADEFTCEKNYLRSWWD